MPSAMLSLPVPQISTHALREEGDAFCRHLQAD